MNSSSIDPVRTSIPAEIKRRVLVEAGHRCAIPTCRYIEVEIHHIVPWAQCKTHDYSNLIALCRNCHARADRGEIDRKSLQLYKLNLRFVHDKFSQLEVDVLFALLPLNQQAGLNWPPVMHILLKRLQDAGYIQINSHPNGSAMSFGMQISPDIVRLTEKGRNFLNDFGAHEF